MNLSRYTPALLSRTSIRASSRSSCRVRNCSLSVTSRRCTLSRGCLPARALSSPADALCMQAAFLEAVEQAGRMGGIRIVDHHEDVGLFRVVTHGNHPRIMANPVFETVQYVFVETFVDMHNHFVKSCVHHDLLTCRV